MDATKLKKGDKANLKVYGAGVISKEPALITQIKGDRIWDQDREYFRKTGFNVEPSMFGFKFELCPVESTSKKKAKPKVKVRRGKR